MTDPFLMRGSGHLDPTKALVVIKADSSSGQASILMVAMFIKGGILGAYIPFKTVWLDAKGYGPRHLAYVAVIDSLGNYFMPFLGTLIDKMRSHSSLFVLMMVISGVLKLCFLPAAGNFALILLLVATSAPLLRACNAVLDAMALYAFADVGHFGRVRFIGEIGMGCIAFFTGWSMDVFKTEDVVFIIFSGLSFFLAAFWMVARPWMTSIRPDTKQMANEEFWSQISILAKHFSCPGAKRALATLALMGMSCGVIGSFELVLMRHMMGSGLLLGTVKLLGTIAALPVWYFMGNMLDAIGLLNVQLVGLVSMALRLYILSVIQHPWQALMSETLAGLGGFSISYCSISIFSGRVVDEDLKSTAQTSIYAIFSGVGGSLGPMIGGNIAMDYGIQVMFGCYARVVAVMLVLFVLYDVYRYVNGSYKTLECEIDELNKSLPT